MSGALPGTSADRPRGTGAISWTGRPGGRARKPDCRSVTTLVSYQHPGLLFMKLMGLWKCPAGDNDTGYGDGEWSTSRSHFRAAAPD